MRRVGNFRDRREAGELLATLLIEADVPVDVVLALPRGGVPVAAEVARATGASLDVLLVRKLGVPGHRELGMGAVAEAGVRVLNHDLIAQLGVTEAQIDATVEAELTELQRRVDTYRAGRPTTDVEGRDVVVVDDGVATGVTARAAIEALRHRNPRSITFAAPVGAADAERMLAEVADHVLLASTPAFFAAVGQFYRDFHQVSDREVVETLQQFGEEREGI